MSTRNRAAALVVLALLIPIALPLIPTASAAAAFGAGVPTFTEYEGPQNLVGRNAGEPSIGINHNTGAVMMTGDFFIDGFWEARIDFDDSVTPARATWTDVTPPAGIPGNVDPILYTDPVTGRTWAGGLDGACSILYITDDDGVNWSPGGNSCVATLDHETIASGPYADPAPSDASYERAVYYCAQASLVTCTASYDGGLTYTVNSVVTCEYTNPGLHGSLAVSPDGTVWLPFGQSTDHICLAKSTDNGQSWTDVILEPATASGGFDPDVATTPSNWVYVGYPDANGRAHVALSKNGGATWTYSPDLGAEFGLRVTTFHEMVAGDDNRAAVAFLGTTQGTPGNAFSAASFNGLWHLYVAYTYDGGQTWTTLRASEEPVQQGCIWDGGGNNACRNLLDFMDAQVDEEGRVLVGYADGCVASAGGPANCAVRSTWGAIARQTTGRGLYAEFDDGVAVTLDQPITGTAGQLTTISASVSAAALPYTVSIDWGDSTGPSVLTGQTGATFNAAHVYSAAANYPVTVTVTDFNGGTGSDSATASIGEGGSGGGTIQITSPAESETVGSDVTVTGILASGPANQAPVASFTSSVAGNTATLDGSGSSDPDGDAITTYQWSFGDASSGTGATTSHTYANAGTYQVCLTVSDGSLTDEDCQNVVIQQTSTRQTIANDPEGDACLVHCATYTQDMDILKLEAEHSALGEPIFTITLSTLPETPTAHLEKGSGATTWRVEWTGPNARIDFVDFKASATTTACGSGSKVANLYSQDGEAECSFIAGTPGKVIVKYPTTALAAKGYPSNFLLTELKSTTLMLYGIPPESPVSGGNTQTYDSTETGEFQLPASMAAAPLGIPTVRAAMAAPSSPPADAHIRDNSDTPPFELVPHMNVTAAWFAEDADNLYVGMHIQDIPATLQQSSFVQYAVSFKPTYPVADATWFGNLPEDAELTSLTAAALYSPARMTFPSPIPSSDTATVFELQFVYQDPTQGGVFGTLANIQGSVDVENDIIWMIVPRAKLQNPPGGGVLTDTFAYTSATIGGLFDSGVGDLTGDGAEYQFAAVEVDPPVVTLAASPDAGEAPLQVTFSATSTSAGAWTIEYGDGATEAGNGAVPTTFTHVYASAGAFTATLSVTNEGGIGQDSASVTTTDAQGGSTSIRVEAGSLPAVTASCSNGCAQWTAQLDLSGLADGPVLITATLLQDGTPVSSDSVEVVLDTTGTEPSGLVIDEPAPNAVVDTGDVTIRGRLAGVQDAMPVATVEADRTQGVAPHDVVFSLAGSDDHGIASWEFTTGDGRVESGTGLPPATLAHTYATPGSYVATLTVRDTIGQSDQGGAAIMVQASNAPPTAPSAPAPADGQTNAPLVTVLTWLASDPDGNTLTYDVYLDTTDASTLFRADQPSNAVMTDTLASSTTYKWRVVAKDGTASTSGPVWSFTTRAADTGHASKPHVVVAVLDSGINPYHVQYRRADMTENPATYIAGMTPNLKQINLCFFDNATKTVSMTGQGCPANAAAAPNQDIAEWQQIQFTARNQQGAGQGNLYWFAGTNILGMSYSQGSDPILGPGDPNFKILDGAKNVGSSHGTATTSDIVGSTTGTCPECIVVIMQAAFNNDLGPAYRWAANQPWIDIISSSVATGPQGHNPGDLMNDEAEATKKAVENGKLVFVAAGNGAAGAGLAPTTTAWYANYAPWIIPVGCNAPHSGNHCFYSDFPAAIDGTGWGRISANVDTYSSTAGAGGTSFSTPSAAGVAARSLYALRSQYNDLQEGPSQDATKKLVRLGSAAAPAQGPLANGVLTRLELEEVMFKTARRSADPTDADTTPTFNPSVPPNPALFIKEGFGEVYRGSWGVSHPVALSGWSSSADITSVILGQKTMPNRWVEEFWWEDIVEPSQIEMYGPDVAETDADAFPGDDAQDLSSLDGYPRASVRVPGASELALRNHVAIPDGTVPTPSATRLYFHAADAGPIPGSVNGGRNYEFYLNSIPAPAEDADVSGIGQTNVNPAGHFLTYPIAHPTLGGPVALDTSKDVVVRLKFSGYKGIGGIPGWDGAPAQPLQLSVTLTTADGTPIGTGTATRALEGTIGVYEARFKPTAAFLQDPAAVTISWTQPAFSAHLITRGESWIELPVQATLPPTAEREIRYYADDVVASYQATGDTIALTRDASRLTNDPSAGFSYRVPVVNGMTANFLASDALVDSAAYLGTEGTFTAYVCTGGAFTNLGANQAVITVGVAVGDMIVGSGSLSVTTLGTGGLTPNPSTIPHKVPIAFRPVALPLGEPVRATMSITDPATGMSHPMIGFCGGGEANPITLDLTVTDVGGPSATLEQTYGTVSGTIPLSGDLEAPDASAVTEKLWYAKDLGEWGIGVSEFTMDTDGPGSQSGGPVLPPSPTGNAIRLASARPVLADIPAIGEGTGRVQFYATAFGFSPAVTVDATILLEDGSGNTRTLGTGSLTRQAGAPVAVTDPFAALIWTEKFVVDFVPLVTDVQADEKLVAVITVHDLGPASTAWSACICGDAAAPVFVALPVDATAAASSPGVDIVVGGVHEFVPAVDGRWATTIDTNQITNGQHTLTITPQATYDGQLRTGIPLESAITVQNIGINTPPTADLVVAPASGAAPLAVVATLTGTDTQTPAPLLAWRVAWGDGSPDATGTGLPATAAHTYAVGNHVAELTVTDGNGATAFDTFSVSAVTPPPAKKIFVSLDGGADILATDDSTDGSWSAWHADVTGLANGAHDATARFVQGDATLATAAVAFTVQLPNTPTVAISSEGLVLTGESLSGTASGPYGIDTVQASTDETFASFVTATSADGFATWSVPVADLGLVEDVETTVFARALSGAASATDSALVTLDDAPNPRILVVTSLPAYSGATIEFQADGTTSASGAAITSYAWSFGDSATATGVAPTHAYARSGTYTVTLTVTDANGQTGTDTQLVQILNRLPTASATASPEFPTTFDDVTITATAQDPDGSVSSLTTTAYGGETRDDGAIGTGGSTLTVRFPDDGLFLVVLRAVDDEGGVSETEMLVQVYNVRPIAALSAPGTVGVGKAFTLDASGSSDPDGTVVEYRFDLGDDTPVIAQSTPMLQHAYDAAGTYQATVTVVDDDGSAITSSAVPIIANAAPVLSAIGNQVVDEGATLAFTVSATDPESDAIAYGVDPLPSGASFDTQTGAFSWTPTFGQSGNYPVTFSAADAYQATTEEIIISVGDVPLPPVLGAIGDKAGPEGQLLAFVVTAQDPDTAAPTFGAVGLPAGATFNTQTGAFAWTPSFTQSGDHPVTFSVTDGVTTDTEDIVIRIANVDRAPALQPLTGGSVKQLSTIRIPVRASDPDGDGVSLTLGAGAPAGMTLTDDGLGRGELKWTPSIAFLGPYPVTVVAASGLLSDSEQIVVNVLFTTAVTATHVSPTDPAVAPESVTTVSTLVRNTGPNTDTFTLSATASGGWTVGNLAPSVTLASGESTTVTMDVTAPSSGTVSFLQFVATSQGDSNVVARSFSRLDLDVTIAVDIEHTIVDGMDTGRGVVKVSYLNGAPAKDVSIDIVHTWRTLPFGTTLTASGTSNASGQFAFNFGSDPRGLTPGTHFLTIRAVNGVTRERVVEAQYRIGATPPTPPAPLEVAETAWGSSCGGSVPAVTQSDVCRNLQGDFGILSARLCSEPPQSNLAAHTAYETFQDTPARIACGRSAIDVARDGLAAASPSGAVEAGWSATCEGPATVSESDACDNARGDFGVFSVNLCTPPPATNAGATAAYEAFQSTPAAATCGTSSIDQARTTAAALELLLP